MKPTKYYTTFHEIIRGDEAIEVEVHYTVDDWATQPSGQFGPPENYDPGNGWLFVIEPIADGYALTLDEMGAIHTYLESNPPEPEYDDRD